MKAVVVVLFVEIIPVSALMGAVSACPLPRRSGFLIRLFAILVAMLMPALVAATAPFGEDAKGMLLWSGFAWGLLLAGAARFVLFRGQADDPGPSNGDGGDHGGPGSDQPNTRPPTGGIPLNGAEPSSIRVRDHARRRPDRGSPRSVPERERLSWVRRLLRPSASWRPV